MFGAPSHWRCPTQRGRGRCSASCSPAPQPRPRVWARPRPRPRPGRMLRNLSPWEPLRGPAVAVSAAREGAGGTLRLQNALRAHGPRPELILPLPPVSWSRLLRVRVCFVFVFASCSYLLRVCVCIVFVFARAESHSHNGKKWDVSLSKQLIQVR